RVGEGDVDVLPPTRPAALHQGGEEGDGGVLGGGEIGDRHRVVLDRLRAQLRRGVEVAGLAVDEGGVGPTLPPLAGLAVTGYRDVDKGWAAGRQRLIVEAPRMHHAGSEVLDEDVDGTGQAPDEVAAIGLGEVDGDQALGQVELHEA